MAPSMTGAERPRIQQALAAAEEAYSREMGPLSSS